MINQVPCGENRWERVVNNAVAEPGRLGWKQHNSMESSPASDDLLALLSRGRRGKELLTTQPSDRAFCAIRLQGHEWTWMPVKKSDLFSTSRKTYMSLIQSKVLP